MANLIEKEIDTQGKYEPLDSMLGITFSSGRIYHIQLRGQCRLIESNSVPTKGGFSINEKIPQIIYKATSSKLYIQTYIHPVSVNVAVE